MKKQDSDKRAHREPAAPYRPGTHATWGEAARLNFDHERRSSVDLSDDKVGARRCHSSADKVSTSSLPLASGARVAVRVNRPAAKTTLAVVALCMVFAVNGKAQCGVSMNSRIPVTMPDAVTARQQAPAQDSQRGPDANAEKPKSSNDSFSIVGLWNVNFISGGQTVDQGFDLWNSDGTEILNDTPPPATGNVCLGVWTKTGPETYKLKHPSWTFDAAGNLNGTAVIRETVTLGAGADSFQGPFTVDVFDLTGKNLMHIEGKITGLRINPD